MILEELEVNSDDSEEGEAAPAADELENYLKQKFRSAHVGNKGIAHPTVGITISCNNLPRVLRNDASSSVHNRQSRAPNCLVSLLVPDNDGHKVHAETELIPSSFNPSFLRPLVLEDFNIQKFPDDQEVVFAVHEAGDSQTDNKMIGKVAVSLRQLVSAHGNFVSYNLTDALDNLIVAVGAGDHCNF